MKKLSIVIPVFNEAATLPKLFAAIDAVVLPEWEKELVIVDDASTDDTAKVIATHMRPGWISVRHAQNLGKGSAVRTGFARALGDIVLIQDADLEYSPKDYPLLLEPILSGDADVVYGSRFISAFPRRALYFSHYIANVLLTFLSNVCTGLNLSDMETGYKVFTRDALMRILPHLSAARFGIEPEITARVAQQKLRIYEVGISYRGRTYEEGKKIRWADGVAAVWHIVRASFFS